MSIMVDNEVDRLFSLAFGEAWISSHFHTKNSEELNAVKTLASSNVDCLLGNIAALGRSIGATKNGDGDHHQIGWAIAKLAEYASVCDELAAISRNMLDPTYRKAFALAPLA